MNNLYKKVIKRLFDIIASFIMLIILSPILLVVAIIVRRKLGTPILFTQERPGKDEKIFKIYKFRTMLSSTDSNGNMLSDKARMTNFGSTLRKTSLDELPELINILKGDMSFVGPRPLLVQYLNRYNDEQKHRHDVRPGLTGWAQVNGRNAIDWETKFEYDCWYVNNMTFVLDVKIFFLTISAVLNRSGISQDGEVTMSEFMGNNEDE